MPGHGQLADILLAPLDGCPLNTIHTFIDFQYQYPLIGTQADLVSAALRKELGKLTAWTSERSFGGTVDDRQVAASFLSQGSFEVAASAFSCALAAPCALRCPHKDIPRWDSPAANELTYPNFQVMAANCGITLIACAGDGDEMLPQALADAVRTQRVKRKGSFPDAHGSSSSWYSDALWQKACSCQHR
jgi:hypothetical protein